MRKYFKEIIKRRFASVKSHLSEISAFLMKDSSILLGQVCAILKKKIKGAFKVNK